MQLKASHFVALATLFLMADMAMASSSGSWGFVTVLDDFRAVLSGPVARAIGVLGIVGSIGALMFGGELNSFTKTIVYVVLVAGVLLTANSFVDTVATAGGSYSSGAQVL